MILSQLWDVLLLFTIPIGGGIPAGVVLAQKYGFHWTLMCALYAVSDLLLAILFEPLMLWFLRSAQDSPKWAKIREELKKSTSQIMGRALLHRGPFSLIMITFGSDPMTGRAIAKAFGHGFFSGWAIVLIGDMLYFLVIMASTIWLNSFLGNGTWTTIIITVLILGVPALWRHLKQKRDLQK